MEDAGKTVFSVQTWVREVASRASFRRSGHMATDARSCGMLGVGGLVLVSWIGVACATAGDPGPSPAAPRASDAADRQAAVAFFAIHFEPRSADDRGFGCLSTLVELAGRHRVKLTLQFTPSWARMILEAPGRVERLRTWQRRGHEVAAHHHGAWHGWEWDGYSNLPEASVREIRARVRERAGPAERAIQELARSTGRGERYSGTMQDYMALLSRLAGGARVLTMTMGPDRDTDWPPGLPFGIDNIEMRPDRSYVIAGTAVSRPRPVRYSDQVVRELSMRFIDSMAAVRLAQLEHARAGRGDVVGVVTHIEDFAGDPGPADAWMQHLARSDPEGVRNVTVATAAGP